MPRQYGGGGGVTWPLTSSGDMGFRPDGIANDALLIHNLASAANGVQIQGQQTGFGSRITTRGDVNQDLILLGSGSGGVKIFSSGAGSALFSLAVYPNASGSSAPIFQVGLLSSLNATCGIQADGGTVGTQWCQVTAIGDTAAVDLRLASKGAGVIDFRYAAVALGGGAAPTLGTIGGTGPAVAAQNSWHAVKINGTVSYLPVWR